MTSKALLGVDVGSVRVGVAVARSDVRIARPLTTLAQGPAVFDELAGIIREHQVTDVVVGWPRGMDGQQTAQTGQAEAFAKELEVKTGVTVHLQDEALTSHKAETVLQARGKAYDKAEVDALAAAYILEDFINDPQKMSETANV